ncbi:uncharacterized protein VP01_3195g4 [Puccinia sorghi]|uniref:Uncharacterized protein n=1 Tax=Puccinia sorghi TaxID=27349 RepID=A0A0L6UYG3_9BASI|nr:uncharacterized protein VP01_3195g4 [Puccinia sorghi]
MLSTPTSKTAALFDRIRSTSSTPSSSYNQECHDNIIRTARSGAPSLQSKSPPSIASFNSGSRYQTSSCSTYSASAAPGAGPSRNIFKKQYIHQAIRLVDDALMEQDKGPCCDESYAVDCYLASLEYLLSAFPTGNLHDRQMGSGLFDRHAVVHAKLVNLIRQTEEFSAPTQHESNSHSTSTESPSGWLNGVWQRAISSKMRLENTPTFVSTPSDLAAQCACGRKVLVKIPESMVSNTPSQVHLQQSQVATASRGFIAGFLGWILAGIFWVIGIINGVIIPYIVTFTIRTSVAVVIYLEKRFQIVNFILKLVINAIKLLVKISRDYQFNQYIAEVFSWIISHLLKIALVFVKQGDLEQLEKIFDVNTNSQNDCRNQERLIKPAPENNRLESFLISQSQPSQLFMDHGTIPLSSRFSLKSDSTYQVNRPDGNIPTWTARASSNLSPWKPDSCRL